MAASQARCALRGGRLKTAGLQAINPAPCRWWCALQGRVRRSDKPRIDFAVFGSLCSMSTWRGNSRETCLGLSKSPAARANLEWADQPMLLWNRTGKVVCVLAAIAAYFALAGWSRKSYVDRTPAGKMAFHLNRPFERYGDLGVVSSQLKTLQSMEALADSDDNNQRSPLLLYENDRLLGPAHSSHEDIAVLGGGRYSHWKRHGILFSSSDKSDPSSNGRSYWAVVPD
jgi:hypothetical protein